MLTNTLLHAMSPVSLTLGLVVMAAAPRSPFSAPRALVLQQAPRAFSTSNLDLVLSQADSAMKTVSKAQDLMMAGCFPCPVFWCTYAHLPWLLQQLDLAWPTLIGGTSRAPHLTMSPGVLVLRACPCGVS